MRRIYIIISLLIICVTSVFSQNVSVEAKIDSVAILIGQQVGMTITVISPEDKTVQLPRMEPRQLLTPGIEIVDVAKDDTSEVYDGRKITRKLILTSFDENAYMIPAQTIKVGGKPYKTNPLALKVITMDVDTLHLNQFFPPKDVQDNPFLWSEWSPLFWLSIILLLLIAIGVYLYLRYKQNKPIISRIMIIKHIPAHQKALSAIDQIKQEKMQNSENQKAYYTKLTDTLRKYIEERFGFSAMEMTSTEIISRLQEAGDPKMISELRELFNTADLVKFAKYSTLINENDLNLVNAVNFIDQTKTQEKETEEKIVPKLSADDKRIQDSRKIIKILLGVIIAVGIFIFCFVVYNAMMLI
jgi:hypothetical protein